MQIKKTTSLISAFILLTACTGCSSKPQNSEQTSGNSEKYIMSDFTFNADKDLLIKKEKNQEGFLFQGKNEPILVQFMNSPSFANFSASAYAEGLARNIKSESKEAEWSVFDNQYADCAVVKTTIAPSEDVSEEFADYSHMNTYYARIERSALSFVIAYKDNNADKIDSYADNILSSLEYTGSLKISNEGGTAENDYFKISYSEKWFASEKGDKAVYVSDDPELSEVNADNCDEASYTIKVKYSLIDSDSLMASGLTLKAVTKSKYSSLDDLIEADYNSYKDTQQHSNLKKEKKEILGQQAECLSYDIEGNDIIKDHVEKYYFEKNGIFFNVITSIPINDDGKYSSDIQELLNNTNLK